MESLTGADAGGASDMTMRILLLGMFALEYLALAVFLGVSYWLDRRSGRNPRSGRRSRAAGFDRDYGRFDVGVPGGGDGGGGCGGGGCGGG